MTYNYSSSRSHSHTKYTQTAVSLTCKYNLPISLKATFRWCLTQMHNYLQTAVGLVLTTSSCTVTMVAGSSNSLCKVSL